MAAQPLKQTEENESYFTPGKHPRIDYRFNMIGQKPKSFWSNKRRVILLLIVIIVLGWLAFPRLGLGAEVTLKLSGSMEFPGIISLRIEDRHIGRLCFLGEGAHGNLDFDFLQGLARDGIPEGAYRVSDALPEEQWPTKSFSKNGALRLVPGSEQPTKKLAKLGKSGLAVHGRDFYPLAAKMTNNSKMVRFVSDRMFDQLSARWGTLRISNWDMGRFQDFYRRTTVESSQWKVTLLAVDLEEIKKVCEPLKVQRKPGGPLE